MHRRELDSRLLIMVTLALVAFGLVMVYSATSAAAAVGGNDPSYYLKRQGVYAALGIVLMMLAQRWDYRRLRALAPLLVLVSLALARRGARDRPADQRRAALGLARAGGVPAVRAREARARDLGRVVLREAPARRARCASCGDRSARSPRVFALLLVLEPDLGTTIALVIMLVGVLVVAGTPARVLATAIALAAPPGIGAIWMKPYSRARFFAFLHPARDAQGTGYQILQAMIGMGSGHIFGVGLGQRRAEDLLPARGAHRHDAREHRRGARAHRRDRRDRRLRALRLRGPRHRACAAAIRSASGSPRG